MRILVWNHTGLVSGGERSMLELVSGLHERGVDVLAASPRGPLEEQLQARGDESVPVAALARRSLRRRSAAGSASWTRSSRDMSRPA